MQFKAKSISYGFIVRFEVGGDFFIVYGRNQLEAVNEAIKLYKYLIKYYDLLQGI